jgi:hypothetical protein
LEIGIAALLLVAGVSKLLDLALWRRALWGYGFRWLRWRPLVALVPAAELTVGFAVALRVSLALHAAAALFAVFAVVLTVAYLRGARGACNCLGSVLPASIGPAAIARATALAAVALVAGAMVDPGLQPLSELAVSACCAAALLVVGELRTL